MKKYIQSSTYYAFSVDMDLSNNGLFSYGRRRNLPEAEQLFMTIADEIVEEHGKASRAMLKHLHIRDAETGEIFDTPKVKKYVADLLR